MKIELTCPHCESVLAVDAEHAGKQLRCPTCLNLTQIPLESEERRAPSTFHQPMADHATPAYMTSSSGSSEESLSLVLGIVGIVMNLGCGCLFPAWLVMNLIGLSKALNSTGSLRTACLVTNGIALGLAALQLFWWFGIGLFQIAF